MNDEKNGAKVLGRICIGFSMFAVAVIAAMYAYSGEVYFLALVAAALAPLVPGIVLLRKSGKALPRPEQV